MTMRPKKYNNSYNLESLYFYLDSRLIELTHRNTMISLLANKTSF